MGNRIFVILILFVCFAEMVGAKPPKDSLSIPKPTIDNFNQIIDDTVTAEPTKIQFKIDTGKTVFGICKKDIRETSSLKLNLADSQIISTIDKPDRVFSNVTEMPRFPGGYDSYRIFLSNNIIYPKLALQNGISGTVIVSFIVSKEGVICNPKIERSLGIELDNETLRIISLMPNWIPGKKDGQPVNVSFMLPVKFTIQ